MIIRLRNWVAQITVLDWHGRSTESSFFEFWLCLGKTKEGVHKEVLLRIITPFVKWNYGITQFKDCKQYYFSCLLVTTSLDRQN